MNKCKEDLYSRQIGTIGKDTMLKVSNLRVFIIGLDTIGIEVAKCLCLLGIKKLYIYHPQKITDAIKGRNFLLYDSKQGDILDKHLVNKLKELNTYVEIESVEYSVHIIQQIDVLIQTESCLNNKKVNSVLINTTCRDQGGKYILACHVAFSGYIFCDFGEKHTIKDSDGEKPKSVFVNKLNIKDNQTELVVSNEGESNLFNSRDLFKFSKGSKTYQIQEINDNRLYINEVLDINLDIDNLIIQVKPEFEINCKSLKCILNESPKYPNVSINSIDQDTQLNVINDMHLYIKNPKLLGKIDTEFSHIINSTYKFSVIGSILGSIISQEVIKTSGKYIPLMQELVIDYSELYVKNTLYKYSPNKNYRDLYNLLPKKVIKYIKNMQLFLVGCGALGCEYLKLLSMLDTSTANKGCITVTDMDHIELSNLNRQFLFRDSDIGNSKSKTAAQKITTFNDKINIDAFDLAIGNDNMNHFNRNFWENQDIILNALDNIVARQFVDNQCVIYSKPLFESGTLGTKCNVQVILPHITKTYSETHDPVDKNIPVCTVKHFPFKIEHCIEWALEKFNEYFHDFIQDIHELSKGWEPFLIYLKTIDNENIVFKKVTKIVHFKECLIQLSSKNIEQFAIKSFDHEFINPIKQLLHSFPLDHVDNNGNLFWAGNKLPPKILNNPTLIKDFVTVFSKILCRCFGCTYIKNHIDISQVKGDNFTIEQNYKYKLKDTDEIKEGIDTSILSEKTHLLLEKLKLIPLDHVTFSPEIFGW